MHHICRKWLALILSLIYPTADCRFYQQPLALVWCSVKTDSAIRGAVSKHRTSQPVGINTSRPVTSCGASLPLEQPINLAHPSTQILRSEGPHPHGCHFPHRWKKRDCRPGLRSNSKELIQACVCSIWPTKSLNRPVLRGSISQISGRILCKIKPQLFS